MKSFIVRIISIGMMAALIFTVLLIAGCAFEGSEASYIVNADTQNGVYSKLISLQSKFPDGKYWNHVVPASEAGVNCSNEAYADSVTETPCAVHKGNVGAGAYDCSFFDGGLQCCGFARKVFYDVFGIRESTLQANAVKGCSGLSVGDFVKFSGFEHYAVVLSISNPSFTVVECNLDRYGAQYNCIIKWGRTYQLSQIEYYVHSTNYDSMDKVCNNHRWDSGKITKRVKHTKTELVNGEKTYTCTVCGETKTEAIKVSHSFKTTKTAAATLKKNGSIKKKCNKCGKTASDPIYRPKTIKVKKASVVYSGKALKPGVIIRDMKGRTIARNYYSVSYKNNKKLGTATAIVKFKERYSGTKKLSFKIVPKGTMLIKCTGGNKRINATWKRTTGIDGYQIQYATRKNFSNKKGITLKGRKTRSKTITNLAAGTTYYVRVRTYKTVNKKKHYSHWSNVLSAKTAVVTERTKAMQAYKAFLVRQESGYKSDEITGYDYDVEGFALHDMNCDGIPELFTHGGGQMDYSKVFTYKSRKIKKVYVGTGFSFYPNGTIETQFNSGSGYTTYSYYNLGDNCDLSYLYRYTEWHLGYPDMYTQGEDSYNEGAEVVEYSVVQKNINKITNGAQAVVLKYYTNSGFNRDAYVK